MPSYYLTDCEEDIFINQSDSILSTLGFASLNIIELGAGDGKKTYHLLSQALHNGIPTRYSPIDISASAVELLTGSMKRQLPALEINPLIGDYFSIFSGEAEHTTPTLFLILGSNIGNYASTQAIDLLKMIYNYMQSDDALLIGYDLKKSRDIVLPAYKDSEGISASFALNILEHCNQKAGTDFDIKKYVHDVDYDIETGEVRSNLVSQCDHVVCSSDGHRISVLKDEKIFIEVSKKYTIEEMKLLTSQLGFGHIRDFVDTKGYFSDSLFRKK